MSESKKEGNIKHQTQKDRARMLLKHMGFKDDEIFEEYFYKFKWYGSGWTNDLIKQRFIIDIVGLNQNLKVAVECGHVDDLKNFILSEIQNRKDNVVKASEFSGYKELFSLDDKGYFVFPFMFDRYLRIL